MGIELVMLDNIPSQRYSFKNRSPIIVRYPEETRLRLEAQGHRRMILESGRTGSVDTSSPSQQSNSAIALDEVSCKSDCRKWRTLSRLLPVRLSEGKGSHAELGPLLRVCPGDGPEVIQ